MAPSWATFWELIGNLWLSYLQYMAARFVIGARRQDNTLHCFGRCLI